MRSCGPAVKSVGRILEFPCKLAGDVIIPAGDAADASADVIVAGFSSADVVSPCDVMYDASEDAASTIVEQ